MRITFFQFIDSLSQPELPQVLLVSFRRLSIHNNVEYYAIVWILRTSQKFYNVS